MDSTLKTLMEAKERINATSVDDRLRGIDELVSAVNGIKALPPEDQVSALTEARQTVDELRRQMAAATAEYEDAHAWLKVLEGVAMGRDVSEAPAVADAPAEPALAAAGSKRSDRTVASVPVADVRPDD